MMAQKGRPHVPVLVSEVVQALVTRRDGVYIDGTVGAGGHAEAILKVLEKGRLVGVDRDPLALELARERLGSSECFLMHGSYEDLDQACGLLGVSQVDGIFLDLGISSMQVDQAERGFSFNQEGPLTMRMGPPDKRDRQTAKEIVNRMSPPHIEKILKEYGEESFAGRIAKAIVEERRKKEIQSTTELAEIVSRAIPRKLWPHRIHPATKTFQALRIAVNQELDRLKNFLGKAPRYLSPGGRLVLLSYHSLEDRLVKTSFREGAKQEILKIVFKKPLVASEDEIRENPRARSVKMRVAERVGDFQ